MLNTKNYKITTYKSHITSKKTMVIVKNKEKYGQLFREGQIVYKNGVFNIEITDGFSTLRLRYAKSLKRAIDMCIEDILPRPWYVRGL